ncbi:MAG: transcription elongation factor GreA [Mycobacteriales bacterium]
MSSTHQATGTWLTQEAYDRLQTEHDELIEGRSAMAAEINERREEGDLKENGGYHAAKEEQGKQEARIRQLEELLRTAAVGEAPELPTTVQPGVVVTVRFGDSGDWDADTETFLLGSREISATTDLTVYSPESALGAALVGRSEGDTVSYSAPNGSTLQATVVKLETFHG